MKHGFVKVAAASPVIKVADTDFNAEKHIGCIKEAAAQGVKVLAFPELSLTGCSCYDLIGHSVLLEGASKALAKVAAATEGMDMLVFAGLPVAYGSRLLSCAAAIYDGEILALVPKANVSAPFTQMPLVEAEVVIGGQEVTIAADCVFESAVMRGLSVGVELGGRHRPHGKLPGDCHLRRRGGA